jgi:hypothetical protein
MEHMSNNDRTSLFIIIFVIIIHKSFFLNGSLYKCPAASWLNTSISDRTGVTSIVKLVLYYTILWNLA